MLNRIRMLRYAKASNQKKNREQARLQDMAQTIYIMALLYSLTVAITLFFHGSFLLKQQRDNIIGIMEILTGVLVVLGVVFFQFDGLTAVFANELREMGSIGKMLALFSIVGAIVSVDYLLARFLPLVNRLLLLRNDSGNDISRMRRSITGLSLGVVAASLLGSTSYLSERSGQPGSQAQTSSGNQRETSSDFTLLASVETPESPSSAAFGEQGYGYITTLNGKIFKFDRPSTPINAIEFDEVASGINFPQGVEVFDGTLFTVDLGEAGETYVGGGAENVRNSNGRVLAFDIESDGSLRNKRTILSNLPVVDRQHSPNGITTGPDRRLYLSIGHIQPVPEVMNEGKYQPNPNLHPNHEYLGTVISFNPDGSDTKIMARGLRNVYDIAFDKNGRLFGGNNDGQTGRSQKLHTLYHIRDDGYYGFPEYGTLDWDAADEEMQSPLWILNGLFPVGVETADKIDYQYGVFVGLFKKVVFVPLSEDEHGLFVPDFLRAEPTVIDIGDGYATIVEADPEGLLYVSSLINGEMFVLQPE